MKLIRTGNTIYIWLGIDDGNENQYPQVKLYEPGSATPIETVNLSHKVDGVYQGSFSYSGSALDVLAIGIIYSDSYGGTENTNYTREIDVFHICDSATYAQNDQIRQSIEGSKILSDDDNTLTIKADDGSDHIVYDTQDGDGNPAHKIIKRLVKR